MGEIGPHSIKKGVYCHSKTGKDYQVIGTALQTETNELLVIYKPLYLNEYELFARPAELFSSKVVIDNIDVERFRFIEEQS